MRDIKKKEREVRKEGGREKKYVSGKREKPQEQ